METEGKTDARHQGGIAEAVLKCELISGAVKLMLTEKSADTQAAQMLLLLFVVANIRPDMVNMRNTKDTEDSALTH